MPRLRIQLRFYGCSVQNLVCRHKNGFPKDPGKGWAFAGQIEWEEPSVTFYHLIDNDGESWQ